ncbi:hypothetical protein BASA50_003602 [Batrachochytrium salamandrivorans]|uniref:Tyrosinase copper-binding domain-containing protein n=1 Tax=Batrachochytrium salamandrivorans TaxID=1357716 RepID=A0ABQ8FHW6_9FUNG|nr:hypothetical protein BASA60_008056 [Batrachochytrium salamandrivorans]KAH6598564.1 hypothetical protein BASA50_003602 [Batrachochytrium salamandrivorans]KAH6600742.1 hypothetical protein BASA61_002159 [Batrachochytrium salamandrivorans]KAH9266958.1 hypothetical protein BASA84_000887 [Batrachochytrium salamandrivorans]KAJ1334714.1 hypothetical protein BSLG_007869 [Batrachochytrium salamandrivorans]
MILSSVLILALTVAPGTFAATGCAQPLVRREWRELTPRQQTDYINAVICLKMSPSRLPRTIRSPSRFDDVAYTHSQALGVAHSSAAFLPWHRAFLSAYENALRDECGYPGALPFWDWTIDSQAPESSSLWSDRSFGGDGNPFTPNRCITNGPYVNFYSTFEFRSCISRAITGNLGSTTSFYTPEVIFRMVSTSRTYDAFRQAVEQGPHNNVHAGIGGTMAIVAVSTNDPIFMLHHANVDRVWSIWQTLNPKLASTYDGRNSNGLVARATDTLPLFGFSTAPTYRVANMFSTTSGLPLCYTYSNSIQAGITSTGTLHQKRNIDLVVNPLCNATEIANASNPYLREASSLSTPPAYDRRNKNKVRCPSRVPTAFVKQMKYDRTTTTRMRIAENDHCAFTNYINSRYPTYKSCSSLSHIETNIMTPITDEQLVGYHELYSQMIHDYQSRINH